MVLFTILTLSLAELEIDISEDIMLLEMLKGNEHILWEDDGNNMTFEYIRQYQLRYSQSIFASRFGVND